MKHTVIAACGCHMGKIRANNEDNFYFNGIMLPEENDALDRTLIMSCDTGKLPCFAVFDGMGGEQYGECASYASAKRMKRFLEDGEGENLPPANRLIRLTLEMNRAVLTEAKKRLTRHMGSTMAGLFFEDDRAWAFNLGDSRVYSLNHGRLCQLSEDHVDSRALYSKKAKPSLTQHLGIDEEEFVVEPTVVGEMLENEKLFLLCSDGLTDMLSDVEIREILCEHTEPAVIVETLIDAALSRGGKDNTTVIVCIVK